MWSQSFWFSIWLHGRWLPMNENKQTTKQKSLNEPFKEVTVNNINFSINFIFIYCRTWFFCAHRIFSLNFLCILFLRNCAIFYIFFCYCFIRLHLIFAIFFEFAKIAKKKRKYRVLQKLFKSLQILFKRMQSCVKHYAQTKFELHLTKDKIK